MINGCWSVGEFNGDPNSCHLPGLGATEHTKTWENDCWISPHRNPWPPSKEHCLRSLQHPNLQHRSSKIKRIVYFTSKFTKSVAFSKFKSTKSVLSTFNQTKAFQVDQPFTSQNFSNICREPDSSTATVVEVFETHLWMDGWGSRHLGQLQV